MVTEKQLKFLRDLGREGYVTNCAAEFTKLSKATAKVVITLSLKNKNKNRNSSSREFITMPDGKRVPFTRCPTIEPTHEGLNKCKGVNKSERFATVRRVQTRR